ncbi:3-isopropylmalate dehydratase large subunit [Alcaligenaceae bacterium LF4-65]|jgi:3-isopropylmalate/(R)-2-methylmalate dehydratase large subunit|uniref:3-isopropylmalate dehydratase large subunit n=1 Tax=Zwartia hollandica TaxID=324606 RepID=A0A953NBN0_9BURK|nr:aconitase/3-isopropylmalate dehydratase large subunit family protein [Zwartia hollandica]MBZ1350699.1 3-isopropylmalate dehydratase large subunit [Zwartia hollandica]
MPSTIVEKILAKHAGRDRVSAGEVVVANIDFAMVTDTRAVNTIKMIDKFGDQPLQFAKNTALVLDHYSPPPSLEAAQIHSEMRNFAAERGTKLYDIGDGICHQVLPEGGHLTCGDLVVGTDTHSVTYGAFNALGTGIEGTDVSAVMMSSKLWFRVPHTVRINLRGRLAPGVWAKDITLAMLGRFGAEGLNDIAIEYVGEAVAAMDIDDRMTLCNHAAELGAMAAILEADEKTFAWLRAHGAKEPSPVFADADAQYLEQIDFDVSGLAPQLARKHEVDDIVAITEVVGQKIQFALIGTCTNGRLDDIRQAASILKGKKLAAGVRMIVTPASRQIYLAALREGLIEVLTTAGASFESAGCGTCVGITNRLVPGDGDTVISTANRNFKGRLSNKNADIWLGSAATVAASALTGYITDPRDVVGGTWRAVA